MRQLCACAARARNQNHLSHGIIALAGLGAADELLHRFAADYAQKLLPAPARPNAAANLDSTPLGSRRNFGGLCLAFDEEVSHHSSELRASVSQQLRKRPRLLDGLSGAAFHAFIHLGLGVRVGSRTMVVEGLAYLSHSWLPVGGASANVCADATWSLGNIALLDVLAAVRCDGRLQQRLADAWPAVETLKTGYFQKAMHAFAPVHDGGAATANAATDLLQYARSVRLPVDSTEAAAALLQASLCIYVCTVGNDYFLLHGVTAAFSLVSLQPLLEPHAATAVCRRFLLALLATFVAQRVPALCMLEAVLPTTIDRAALASAWALLRERAVGLKATPVRNEHAYKVVWLCLDRANRVAGCGEGEKGRLLYAAARKALDASLTGRTGERPLAP